ncbi:hypothetical protein [Streptacidiphilus sp. MAP5-52]|uniref:hypothetical protein n=1 Tax=Streptacidiphilus sp. MAP5-52 TaxID=3156267 RepID=UPI00351298AC
MQQTTSTSDQLTPLTTWVDAILASPAPSGALLEQRHVLDEAAHPNLTQAFHRLPLTATEAVR